jgi:flagellar operon protein
MKITNDNMIVHEIQKINPVIRSGNVSAPRQSATVGTGFNEILKDTIESRTPLQFSKHANMRLSARDINLSDSQIKRVEDGVLKAKIKGVRDSLVIVDDVALVVNVQNKIVVTALNKEQNDGNVFTNIDGAVIV